MKKNQYKKILTVFLSLLLWGAMTGMWGYVWLRCYSADILNPFVYWGNVLVTAVYGVILFLFQQLYGTYRIGYYQRGNIIFSGMLATLLTNGITYFQTSLVARRLVAVMPIVWLTVLDFALILVWGLIVNKIYFAIFSSRKLLLVYGGEEKYKESLVRKMKGRSDKYKIEDSIAVDEGLDAVYERCCQYEAVVLCDISTEKRNDILKFCFDKDIRVYLTPKISDIIVRGAENINLFDSPLLLCKNHGLDLPQRIIKRAMDLIISGVGLIVASPFMLLTALAIKLEDGGPAFFRQTRCTIGNKQFEILKFRSMIVDAEKDGKPRPAIDHDPRITKVGRFIRATRLDELPQLINVFRGDMSIVGPRPERIEHVEKYTKEIPEFVFRSKVKGGLTGYAQIVGRYNTSAYDKLKMDLMYIQNYSVLEDIRLILMTIKIMFVKDSTAGFEEEENN